jgi:hypothetical protein
VEHDVHERHGHLHDGLRAVDDLVAKALGIGELAQAAKIETRQREFLSAQWKKTSQEAVKAALAMLRSRSGPITAADIGRVTSAVDRAMAAWPKRVTSRHIADLKQIYELAHLAAAKKGLGFTRAKMDYSTATFPVQKAAPSPYVIKPSFNTVDREAVRALTQRQQAWIGEHYAQNVQDAVGQSVKGSLIAGTGREVAGRALKQDLENTLSQVKTPDGFNGSEDSYFEGLAAHSATQARVFSQLNTFDRLGYTTYEIVNPNDHRTCERCQAMDGHVFTVQEGMARLNALSKATTLEAAKKASPYITRSEAAAVAKLPKGNLASSRGLAARGNVMPPFHFKCRCNLDVVSESTAPPIEIIAPVEPPKPRTPQTPRIPRTPKAKPKTVVTVPKEPLPPRSPEPSPVPDKVDIAALRQEIPGLRGAWARASDTGDYKDARKKLEEYMKKYWGISQNPSRLYGAKSYDVTVKEKMRGLNGFFEHYRGIITLRGGIARGVNSDFKQLTAGLRPTHGLRTLIHEITHGANRCTSGVSTSGAGLVLNESITELTARRIAFDMAKHPEAAAVDYGFSGSYPRYIKAVRDSVERGTSWKSAQAGREIERAALKMNTTATPMASTKEEYARSFVKALPSASTLTEDQVEATVKELLKMRK